MAPPSADLTADVSLAEVSCAVMRLPDAERFALALELHASIPEEYEVDDDETLLRRPDVREGIQGMIDVIEGREQALSLEEYKAMVSEFEAEAFARKEWASQRSRPASMKEINEVSQGYKVAV